MNVPLAPMSFLHTYFCGGDLRGKVAPQRSLQEITNEASNYDCSARPIYSKIVREIDFTMNYKIICISPYFKHREALKYLCLHVYVKCIAN